MEIAKRVYEDRRRKYRVQRLLENVKRGAPRF